MLQRLLLAFCLFLGLFGDATSQAFKPGYGPGFKTGLHPFTGGGGVPGSDAIADYDFRTDRYRGPPLTTTRASSAMVDDSAGNWISVGPNTLRRSDKGVLIEEQRTNLVRHNTLLGAVVGTPGTLPTTWGVFSASGLTTDVVAVTNVKGVDVLRVRISGTTSATFYVLGFDSTPAAASVGQVLTSSVFAAIYGGSLTNISNIYTEVRQVGGGAGNTDQAMSLSSTLVRQPAAIRTMDTGATGAYSAIYLQFPSSGVAVDVTLDIGLPQLELGAFPTSPIRTSGAAVTRAADVVTAPISNVVSGSFAAVVNPSVQTGLTSQSIAALSDGTTSNRFLLYRSNTGIGALLATPPTATATTVGTLAQSTRGAISGAFASADRAVSVNGGTVGTNATAGADPAGIDQLQIGLNGGSSLNSNGYIERLAVYPYRKSNAELQQLSTLANWDAAPAPTLVAPVPMAGANFDYDFTKDRYFGPGLTVTRASTGYIDDIAGNWTSVATNTLRRSDKGVLIEEARTNALTYSHDYSQAAWSKSNVTLGTGAAGPFGVASTAIIEDATSSVKGLSVLFAHTSGTAITFSAIAKAGGRDWFRFFVTGPIAAGTQQAYFNLQTGAVGSAMTGTTRMRALAGGFWLCEWTVTPDTTGGSGTFGIRAELANGAAAGFPGVNGSTAHHIAHAQIENGAFATSPIRTTSAAATRAQDVVSASFSGTASGTFAAVISPNQPTGGSANQGIIATSDGTTSNRFVLYRTTTTNGSLLAQPPNTGATVPSPVLATGARAAFSGAFSNGERTASINGSAVTTQSSAAADPVGLTQLQIGTTGAAGAPFNGYIERAVGYPIRKPDSQLQTLSTLATWDTIPTQTVVAPVPVSGAIADYNFKTGEYFGPALTVTRASTGYVEDSAGNWTSVASGVLRRSDKGVLIEEARTNSIRNSAAGGAVAGTPGTPPTNWAWSLGATGLSTQVVGVGTEKGIDYAEFRVFGTAAATAFPQIYFEGGTSVAAVTAQTWTLSSFASKTAGTFPGAVYLGVDEVTSGGAYVTGGAGASIASSFTSELQRLATHTRTLSGGGTVAALKAWMSFGVTSGQVVDFTIRIGWPQLEQGAFATSPIRTTTVAATRAADVVTGTLASGITQGTIAVVGSSYIASPNGAGSALLRISTGGDRVDLRRAGTDAVGFAVTPTAGSQTQATTANSLWTINARHGFAGGFSATESGVSVDGSAAATQATNAAVLAVSTVNIGQVAGATPVNGYLERLAVWPTRRPNADLQSLSTLANWGG